MHTNNTLCASDLRQGEELIAHPCLNLEWLIHLSHTGLKSGPILALGKRKWTTHRALFCSWVVSLVPYSAGALPSSIKALLHSLVI